MTILTALKAEGCGNGTSAPEVRIVESHVLSVA
jgi:hypothetical protein